MPLRRVARSRGPPGVGGQLLPRRPPRTRPACLRAIQALPRERVSRTEARGVVAAPVVGQSRRRPAWGGAAQGTP
eukprot:7988069-Alexandrium_andersonii.AAC.1